MVAMVVFGIGEVCGCLFIGQIIDNHGSRIASGINVALIVLMTFVTLAFLGINQFNMLAFFMTFLWGVQDACVNTHTYQISGFEFDNNSEPFSLFNFNQAIGTFLFQLIESALDSRTKYIVFTSFIGLLGIYSCGLTCFFEFREVKEPALNMSMRQQQRTIVIEMPEIGGEPGGYGEFEEEM